jgi:hypothetical protein
MSLILLLPILVSGFTYCNKRYTQFIKLHRYQGQYLYLKSVKYGLFIVLISAGILSYLSHLFPTCTQLVDSFLNRHISSIIPHHPDLDINEITSYTKITVLSIVFSYMLAFSLNFINILTKVGFPLPLDTGNGNGVKLLSLFRNWWESIGYNWRDTKILLSCDILSDSPLDKIFIDAYSLVEEILITTDSGKVYVGFIANLAEPNESKGIDQEIKIIPTCSGYRDSITKKVIFNTYYPEEDTNSYIIIKQDLIISASPFSKEIYDQVNKSTSIHGPLSN